MIPEQKTKSILNEFTKIEKFVNAISSFVWDGIVKCVRKSRLAAVNIELQKRNENERK